MKNDCRNHFTLCIDQNLTLSSDPRLLVPSFITANRKLKPELRSVNHDVCGHLPSNTNFPFSCDSFQRGWGGAGVGGGVANIRKLIQSRVVVVVFVVFLLFCFSFFLFFSQTRCRPLRIKFYMLVGNKSNRNVY